MSYSIIVSMIGKFDNRIREAYFKVLGRIIGYNKLHKPRGGDAVFYKLRTFNKVKEYRASTYPEGRMA